ncbi:MAG: DUF3427 domain-containing protein [Ignavibacteriales bacterium]
MADPVTEYAEVIKNVQRYYADLVDHSESIELPHHVSHWYYIPEIDAFGPAKFIGFKDMTAVKYNRGHRLPGEVGRKNGGRAIRALSKWFVQISAGSPAFNDLASRLENAVRSYGYHTKRRYVIEVPRSWKWTGFTKRLTRPLVLSEQYSREEIHDIFDPGSTFKPRCGTWGALGLIRVPGRPRDFVFMVTFGQEQAGHRFQEGITHGGLLTWQSQPHQGLDDRTILQLISHDHSKDSIHLFLRTKKAFKGQPADYTYLGKLAYVSHDPETSKPVWFKWQILDWALLEETRIKMGLEYLDETQECKLASQNAALVTGPVQRAISRDDERNVSQRARLGFRSGVERQGEGSWPPDETPGPADDLVVSSGERRNHLPLEDIECALGSVLEGLSVLQNELDSGTLLSGTRRQQIVNHVRSFRHRVEHLHNEWKQQLVGALRPLNLVAESSEMDKGERIPVLDVIFSSLSIHGTTLNTRERFNRTPTHDVTSSPLSTSSGLKKDEIIMRILESLVELGGKVPVARVLERIENKIAASLSKYDKAVPSNQKEARWRLRIRGMRKEMETAGLLDRHAPWGIWAITDKGRAVEERSRSVSKDRCG